MTGEADLTIRQGDTTPAFTLPLFGADGALLDLTGATCQLVVRELNATGPVVHAAMTVTDAAHGQVAYQWSTGDTATAGFFMAEVHVTFADASTYTYPNDGYLTVLVEENLTSGMQSLVSLGDAKDVLLIDADDHTHDAKILRFVRGVQTVVEAQVGPVVCRTFDEWYDGGSPTIRLRYRPSTALGTSPVLTLVACSEYIGPVEWPLAIVSTPDKGQTYSCLLDPSVGTVTRRTAGGGVQAFAAGPQSVHAVYRAGQQQTPWNIYEGTLELLREHYLQTQQIGIAPSSPDEVTSTSAYIGFLVSGKVRQWLAPMRKHPSIA